MATVLLDRRHEHTPEAVLEDFNNNDPAAGETTGIPSQAIAPQEFVLDQLGHAVRRRSAALPTGSLLLRREIPDFQRF